ncbi:hypothetical protein ACFFX0_11460 [Citricoccus parietis]|uniref:Uncharacterized protein n=1 Tax=Citricoccus parietis TaxID=592307 RepID=A0ABV5FYQ4_9MICC
MVVGSPAGLCPRRTPNSVKPRMTRAAAQGRADHRSIDHVSQADPQAGPADASMDEPVWGRAQEKYPTSAAIGTATIHARVAPSRRSRSTARAVPGGDGTRADRGAGPASYASGCCTVWEPSSATCGDRQKSRTSHTRSEVRPSQGMKGVE